MKIAIFTSNHPRHFALLRAASAIADQVVAVQECTTLFPGAVKDFYRKSEVMETYFTRVLAAEHRVFGSIAPLPRNVRVLALREGDINSLPLETFSEYLDADQIVVYGASFLKGDLCREMVAREAVNIHIGVSPYYRGSSCNFWAMYDGRYEMVGATIHRLS